MIFFSLYGKVLRLDEFCLLEEKLYYS
jgi:hypothetical protein